MGRAHDRWPGHFPAGTTLNGLVAHEDWFPTFAAVAGAPDIKDKLLKGVELNGRSYKNYIDGYNQLAYLSGTVKGSPRHEFIYVNDDGQIVAMRYKYHIVFVPKYRRRVIYGQLRWRIGRIIRELCQQQGVELLEGHAMPDHVHLWIHACHASGSH